VDLKVVTFIRKRQCDETNQFISTARALGVSVETVDETGPFDLSVLPKLRQIFAHEKPDIIQTHSVKSHFLVSLLGQRGFPWIAFHHGYTSENLRAKAYRQFDKWSLRSCDFIVTVCQAFANGMPARHRRRGSVFVLPNSVKIDFPHRDAQLSEQLRTQLGLSPDTRVVLTIGRLSPEKGHRFLIEAVSKILTLAPQLKFSVLITGAGSNEDKLRKQIDERALRHIIKLIGHWSDVRPLFAIADLFVLPSLSEGSPNVLLESMAARVPIVATNVGGVPELVENGQSAILVPPANSDKLAESILEVLNNRPLAQQIANVAYDRSRLMFSPAKYEQRILEIYDAAIHNNQNRNDNRASR
jgi:glycosyltransferase involved in cell wall biosynthesis